jgi:hypothetical protein
MKTYFAYFALACLLKRKFFRSLAFLILVNSACTRGSIGIHNFLAFFDARFIFTESTPGAFFFLVAGA